MLLLLLKRLLFPFMFLLQNLHPMSMLGHYYEFVESRFVSTCNAYCSHIASFCSFHACGVVSYFLFLSVVACYQHYFCSMFPACFIVQRVCSSFDGSTSVHLLI